MAASLLFFRLGDRPLRNPDEGRYAEVAREMVVSGNWVEPTLYGVDYLRKPVLFYWLISASYKLFGVNEWSARAVPAFFGWLGVLMTFVFARRHFGDRQALCAGLILATNPWYLQVSRYLLIDAVFSFFVVGSLLTAYHVWVSGRSRWVWAFFVFAAGAFLSKGVAAVAIPVCVMLLYALISRQPGRLKRFFSPVGIVIFLALVLPWFVAISREEPEFLNFFFLHEHFSRFTAKDFEHQEPWYFYWVLLPVIFFPWSCLLGLFKRIRLDFSRSEQLPGPFLVVAFLATVFFYSLSRSKLPTYLLPVIPLGAVLLGDAVVRWFEGGSPSRSRARNVGIALGLLGLLILSAAAVITSPLWDRSLAEKIPAGVRPWVFVFSIGVAAECVYILRCIGAGRRKALFVSILISLVLGTVPIALLIEEVNGRYTTKEFAGALKPLLKESDEVYLYGPPGAFYDMAFYLDRPVGLVGLEGELVFNEGDHEAEERAIDRDEWERKAADEGVYTLMRVSDYNELDEALRSKLSVVHRDERKILVH